MNTIIIGAGQAGIGLSYYLQQHQIDHLILERDQAFSAWSKRWNSFHLNTANWMNTLPGFDQAFVSHKKWYDIATRAEALAYFQRYIQHINPPLKEGINVNKIVQHKNSWHIHTDTQTYEAQNVVMCTGHTKPFIPSFATACDNPQIHSSDYRKPSQITTQNVLVVGSGSSGVQICHDLARSTQFDHIYFAISNNRIIPWSILGIPIGVFPRIFPLFNIKSHSWFGKWLLRHKSGGDPAMAPSPQTLSQQYGVHLVGRVTNIDKKNVHCQNEQTIPLQNLTLIWATGYRPDHSLITVQNPSAVFRPEGPIHKRGVATKAPGLYFVGLRYQHTLGSHLLHGVKRDAQYIAKKIAKSPHSA